LAAAAFRRSQARGEYLRTAQREVTTSVPMLSGNLVGHQVLNVGPGVHDPDVPWCPHRYRWSVRGTTPVLACHRSTSRPARFVAAARPGHEGHGPAANTASEAVLS
jgi:hypothetical protein